jgi:hypothetical protein
MGVAVATIGGGGESRVIACCWELPAGVAMVTRGGRGKGEGEEESPWSHGVAAHRTNRADIPKI